MNVKEDENGDVTEINIDSYSITSPELINEDYYNIANNVEKDDSMEAL